MHERMKEQVGAGAKFLDREHPGWEDVIDIDRLNMESPYYDLLDDCRSGCVAAQVLASFPGETECCGSFENIRDRLGLWGRTAEDLGFYPDEDKDYVLWENGTVDVMWIDQIETRREATR